MLKRLFLGLFVSAAFAGSLACATDEARWHGKLLVQVGGKTELPAAIKSALRMDEPGESGVADIGENKVNLSGDAFVTDWPNRALLGAGHLGEEWVVVLVLHSGPAGPRLWLYQFQGSKLVHNRQLRDWEGRKDTFALVVSEVGAADAPRTNGQ